jgi:ubiquinone/menaquinone biosynthesis C-methylase UbiE
VKEMSAEESFKQIAPVYDEYRKPDELILRLLSEEIRKLAVRVSNLSMLDVGCGTGGYSIPLAKRFAMKLTGIDVSGEMLERARAKYTGGNWILGDIESIDFEEKSFDVVLMSYVLHHVRDYKRTLKTVYKILKRASSLLFIVTDDHDQFHSSFYHRYMPRIMEIDLSRFPKVNELRNYLKRVNFKVRAKKVRREQHISCKEDIDKLVEQGKARYFSTLTLLTDKELDQGLERVKKALERQLRSGPIKRVREKTVLIAQPS